MRAHTVVCCVCAVRADSDCATRFFVGVQVDVTAGGVVGGPAPVWNKTASQEDLVLKQGAMTANQINSALRGMAVQVTGAPG